MGKAANVVLMVLGALLLVFDIICPVPPILGISGVIWRVIIGVISICLLIIGIKKIRMRDLNI